MKKKLLVWGCVLTGLGCVATAWAQASRPDTSLHRFGGLEPPRPDRGRADESRPLRLADDERRPPPGADARSADDLPDGPGRHAEPKGKARQTEGAENAARKSAWRPSDKDNESVRVDRRAERDKSTKPEPSQPCEELVQLRAVQPLVLGTVMFSQRLEAGFVAVTPQGDVLKSDELILKKQAAQAELVLCGAPLQEVVLLLAQPSYPMKDAGGKVLGELGRFTLKGRGIDLERVDAERWEGRLGPSGRAEIQVGATAQLRSFSNPGVLMTEVVLKATPK